jgi:hypothetical protein
MVAKALKTGLMSAALFGAALLSAGQASAASYSVSLDPAFGGIFPNLGWEAEGTIELTGGCEAAPDGFNLGSSCTGLSFSSMSVSFYDVADLSKTAVETFILPTSPVSIQSFTLTGGELTQIEAGFFANFSPTTSAYLLNPAVGAYSFALYISGGVVGGNQVALGDLVYFKAPSNGPSCRLRTLGNTDYCGINDVSAVGAITPVPEPETYALMLAGLAAVGFMARRRRMV